MDKKNIVIRVDGNPRIGLGHIYRGIAFAQMLKKIYNIRFITKKTSNVEPVLKTGFRINFIPDNIALNDEPLYLNKILPKNTIIVLDGYNFSELYQLELRKYDFKVVYIDDFSNGVQQADLVINHSPGAKEDNYKIEQTTKLALGLDYAILRQSFLNFDRTKVKERNKINKILVSFGGADPNDLTYDVVLELLKISEIKNINIILGSAYNHHKINQITDQRINIFKDLSEKEIIKLMLATDLAIVPASTISIELASLGVPMLLGYYTDNQKSIYKGFVDEKSVIGLGDFNKGINLPIQELNNISLKEYSSRLLKMFKGSPNKNIICVLKEL